MSGISSNALNTKVRYYMPSNDILYDLADLFSTFSDSTRIKILFSICIEEMCVGDIASILELNQTTVSHQLKILKSKNIVTSRRDGKIIYYSLQNNLIPEIMKYGSMLLGF